MHVAPSAFSSLKKKELLVLALRRKIMDKLTSLSVTDCGSRGNRDNHILAVLSIAVPALTVTTVLRLENGMIAKVGKSTEIASHTKNDTAAPSTVTAVGSSVRNIFLAPK